MDQASPYPGAVSPAVTPSNRRVLPRDVLQMMRVRAEKILADGEKPLAVFDLDATLFDNRPRILRILRDTVLESETSIPTDIIERLKAISPSLMSYKVRDTLISAGITDKVLLELFEEEWFKRFFTDRYVVYDLPNPGARDFVQKTIDTGIMAVYLTGRDTPGMRRGTLQSLEMHGFPLPEDKTATLITKPTYETSDLEFKQKAIERIRDLGVLTAAFDNEPKMNNTLARAFSDSLHVFLDTMHSPDWELLEPDILVMKDFALE